MFTCIHVCIYIVVSPLQLRSRRQLVPLHEDGAEGPVHPHLRGERRREDGGVQEDPAVLRRHLSRQRAGADGQGPPPAVQPGAGGERRGLASCRRTVSVVGGRAAWERLFMRSARLSQMASRCVPRSVLLSRRSTAGTQLCVSTCAAYLRERGALRRVSLSRDWCPFLVPPPCPPPCPPCRPSAMPRRCVTTTRAASGSTWTSSLTSR